MATNFSLKQLEATILGAIPSFPRDLANLVMEYSHLPSTQGWITEWTGDVGHRVVTKYITKGLGANPVKKIPGFVSLVVDFCEKSEIFRRRHLEEAVGGEEYVFNYLPHAGPERPLPFDIDEQMQQNL